WKSILVICPSHWLLNTACGPEKRNQAGKFPKTSTKVGWNPFDRLLKILWTERLGHSWKKKNIHSCGITGKRPPGLVKSVPTNSTVSLRDCSPTAISL